MTVRSVIVGLLGAFALAAVCYFNDYVIRQGALVPHLMPVVVYGSLVLFLLFLNPLLRRLRASWVMTGKELAVVTSLILVACAIPSWGLIQCLPTSVMMPHYFQKVRPGWQQQDAVSEAPPQMLVHVTEANEDQVLSPYMTGMSEGDKHARVGDIPWFAWRRTLIFWVPLMLCCVLGVLGLAVVFHRQWVHHEQLPYPISMFAHSLLPGPGRTRGAVFGSRLFWLGFLAIFAVQMNNYLCHYWPEVFIPVRMWLDFTPLSTLTPTLVRGGGMALLRPRLYFMVIGLAYFIASDVSFSMAVVPFIFCIIMGVLAGYGINLRTGDHLSVKIEAYLFTGGYLGILLMLLYTGRHYYVNVLKRSVLLRAHDTVEPHVVWAMRTFLLAMGLFIVQLVSLGLDWPLALLYTGLALMIFIVVSRTIAETGAFHIGSEIFPGAIIMGVFGAAALGPRTMIIMFVLSSVLLGAPGWSPMPFIAQSLKLADMSGVRIGRMWMWICLVLVLTMAISLPVTIYWQYDQGVPRSGWPRMLSAFPFENVVKIKQRLTAQGRLSESREISGLRRFASMTPNKPCTLAFFIALTVALGIGIGRLRFSKWPLHPVVFVFLGGHQAKMMGGAFFIGWLIKTMVSKYGGGKLYQQLKPFMIGIIAGEIAARLVPMLIGAVVYAVTGHSPTAYYG